LRGRKIASQISWGAVFLLSGIGLRNKSTAWGGRGGGDVYGMTILIMLLVRVPGGRDGLSIEGRRSLEIVVNFQNIGLQVFCTFNECEQRIGLFNLLMLSPDRLDPRSEAGQPRCRLAVAIRLAMHGPEESEFDMYTSDSEVHH
jgi:hypothetical protein